MGLSHVLNVSTTGLRATQSNLEVVARNIANAGTPGYTRKSLNQQSLVSGGQTFGVLTTEITREIDEFLQLQLRKETSNFSALEVRQQFLDRIDQLFGTPGEVNALDTIFNNFTESLQDLAASPESFTARESAVGAAQIVTQQLRNLSAEVQSLRQLAEDSLGDAVVEVNDALKQLGKLNLQLTGAGGGASADLLDERDKLIGRVAEMIDIRVEEDEYGAISIFTGDGNALLAGTPVTLIFDQSSDIGPQSLYDQDPLLRGVGTISILDDTGYSIDLIRNGALNSGRIGALIELRDQTLVETQAQLDELAHGLALSLATRTEQGVAATAGAQAGFDLDTTGLQQGDVITLQYTDTATSTLLTVSIIRVDDPTQLPLDASVTPDPNDTVIGVSFAGGIASVAAALDAALGANIDVSTTGGNVLRILDDGAAGLTDIDGLSARITSTGLQDEGLQLALFVDGGNTPTAYTANFEGGSQKLGFAGRIGVNTQIVANNELLVRYNSSPETPIGAQERPIELLARLTETSFAFSPTSGIGASSSPFSGTVSSFTQRVVSFQTGQAARAAAEKASQELVVTTLADRFDQATGVDVDSELSDLITLQNAFAANARVMQTVNDLMQVLLNI